jgi:hypothetical protein
MRVSEHANYFLNEYGRLQFDYAAYCKPYGESLRNEARNNLEEYIAELEEENDRLQAAWFEDETICPDGSLKPIVSTLLSRIAKLKAEVTKCHELQDSYCDRIAELEAAQRWIRTKVKLPDRAVRQFYEVVCLHQDFAELALFSKGRWIIYEGTSVYDITDRVVFWRRRQPLPAEVMDVLNKRQELQ